MYAIQKLNTKDLSEKSHGIDGSDEAMRGRTRGHRECERSGCVGERRLSFPVQNRESTWKDAKPRSFCQGGCSSANALSFRIYILVLNGTLDECTVIYCSSRHGGKGTPRQSEFQR